MVRLLRGSGTRPTLVVSSAPHEDVATPTTRGQRVTTGDRGHAAGHGSVKKHSREFKEKMEQVLMEDERQQVIQQLTRFSQNRYIDDNYRNLLNIVQTLYLASKSHDFVSPQTFFLLYLKAKPEKAV